MLHKKDNVSNEKLQHKCKEAGLPTSGIAKT